ncbi:MULTISPECIES: tetratricopeptide repeat protein [Reichenbachiella]|uniref:Tetratricopeptide repeat-containing protein n=1 Tax=Reichenbachiella agariperforans TaxID=156994 RepID=A0A1M6TMG7_REIAG|nr:MULTISPECIES: tetratricopeptide repeat protein [Reichenbachiella]MBU2915497.1 tetratricopeptide repeat protein [Reichenbachiella agariperforans]RJE71438.1 cytochrome C biosynthesis protein [Reichenbachiella sp. MSK19-1]SHK58106.1 Tetratricopeptide repeat-containing protein [Reichenbachiella agariperforans]
MTKKRKDAESHGNDLLESPEALAAQLSRTEHFIEKNKTLVSVLGGVVAVIIIGFLFGRYYIENQNENAQRDMFQAVYYFEADSLGLALNGDGNNYGFLEIMDSYGMTDAANLASYYTGATYLKLGDYDNALKYLKEFSADDYLIQSRAYALTGDAYMELGKFSDAAGLYERAANYQANDQFSPVYLVKAAIANEKAGSKSDALANYETIVEKYSASTVYQDAVKHVARLEGLQN